MAPPAICVVCDKLASLRCSGCSVPSYCSKTCQTYVWSTHKWFCKQDEAGRHTWSVPPLTSEEASVFDDSRGRVLSARYIDQEGQCDWLICIDRVGWYESDKNAKGMRVDLLRDLQKPKAQSIAEPQRSYILALLNETFYTFRAATDTSTDLNESAAGPFHMAGLDICTIIRFALQNNCLRDHFFRLYNEFFQEILIFHTVGLTQKVPNEIRGTFTKRSSARLTNLAEHMHYDDPKIKEAFLDCAARCARTATACTIM
ncbi:hypothetical protein JCM10908_005174 [Rhodotorula pacifica]|uniref:zinc finger MYND domain-containing protein n=1 Tax=Rhodotorula pacifica TaxID=1495444 RepID=UPI00317336A3